MFSKTRGWHLACELTREFCVLSSSVETRVSLLMSKEIGRRATWHARFMFSFYEGSHVNLPVNGNRLACELTCEFKVSFVCENSHVNSHVNGDSLSCESTCGCNVVRIL